MDNAASVAIQVLLQNLIDISKDEISLIRGLEEDADNLKATLTTIQSFLDDAQEKVIDAAVKTWLNELEAVAFDADNVLDELNYRRLSDKLKSIQKKKKKVPSCCPSFSHCVIRRDMALRIKKLNMNFKSIIERATKLGLERRLADAPDAALEAAQETDSFTIDPIFIGRDDEVAGIVKMLTTPTDEAVSIVPIVGMGGLGKTTLARNVFNHHKIKTHFGQHIWVHVSQNFDPEILFKKILTNLTKGSIGSESREVLLSKLQQALGDKTYLLVLDDVWNEDQHKWGNFINAWIGITSTKGNGIIVTTRINVIGSIVKRKFGILQLEGLSDDQCWSIIKDRAFDGGDIPLEFEVIGRNIARRCQGLPLGANVVGGVLRDKSLDEWLSIELYWLSNVGEDENDISKILKLSYHHLPSPSLKKCFAYCSVFPKGTQIDRVQLIELWMAEGFLQPSQTSDHMQNVGEKFFNLLLQNSLLQVMHRDGYDTIVSCSMHDLVHDLASSVLGSLVKDESTYRSRYICWEDKPSRIPKEQAKWLRTLIYNGRISDIVFSDFKSLHALTLISYHSEELPDSIKELTHLRCLDILGTQMITLPESVGELYHLQTLRTSQKFKKFPKTLNSLINLKHLHVIEFLRPIELPPHLGKLTSLQTIPYFKVCKEEGCRIEELGSLKNLKGELKIYNLEKVQGEEESKKAYLFQKSGIVSLKLAWDDRREDEINDENVLKDLQPHPNLKILQISGYGGARFPSWSLKMAVCLEDHWVLLHNLIEVRLEECAECEEIPSLGHLPLLKTLKLCGLKKVKFIDSSFYGVCKETVSVFPTLEKLKLISMNSLREWRGVEIPRAAEVKIFPRLNNLKIENCQELVNMFGTELTSLTALSLGGLHKLACLPDWLFENNQSLTKLKIKDCPMLKELPNDLPTLNSLELLRIRKCPNLKSIACSSGQGFKLLSRLSIGDCPELMDFPWEIMLSLEVLELGGRLMNIPKIMECLSNMSRLKKLEIHIFPQVIVALPATLPSLQTLTIHSGDSVSNSSFNEVVDGILLRLGSHSLSILSLTGKGDWESLPDQLQHLTSLSKLDIICFGIEELPEWFGNLSSLQSLTLLYCPRLKRLPSVEAMRRLTKLTHLVIFLCKLLKVRYNVQQCGDDDDSEWPKISHIPTIELDWFTIQEGGRGIEDGGRQQNNETVKKVKTLLFSASFIEWKRIDNGCMVLDKNTEFFEYISVLKREHLSFQGSASSSIALWIPIPPPIPHTSSVEENVNGSQSTLNEFGIAWSDPRHL